MGWEGNADLLPAAPVMRVKVVFGLEVEEDEARERR